MMAQQIGFRATSNLSELLDRDKCWDNLSVNRSDLPLLYGTGAAGVTSADYAAIHGLTSPLEGQVVAVASGSTSSLSVLQGKIKKTGDFGIGNIFASIVNNDRPYVNAGNQIYGPSLQSFFSPASASGFSTGAEYKLGPVQATTATISGFNYAGITAGWNDYFVKYKQYLSIQEQPSWTEIKSPLYLASPLQFAGNVLWLDSEFSQFVQDGSGVRQWKDVIGRGAAIQNTTVSQPSFAANLLNGKPGVTFDGSNDWLSLGNISALFPSGCTFIVVATIGEPSARGSSDYNIFSTLNNTTARWRKGNAKGSLGMFTSATLTDFPSYMPANGTYVFTVQASPEYGIGLRANSAEAGLITNQFTQNVTYSAGDIYILGANANASAGFFSGTIYSMAFFNRILPAKELRSIEEYFAWRYDFVFDPDRTQSLELEDGNTLDTEGGSAFYLG
jgi:hypothetical protein